MNYWLVKSEPGTYSWDDLIRDGSTFWDGVRNFAARNHMQAMKKGDQVLYYHSGKDKGVVGVCELIREAYPDPSTDDERFVAVDLKPLRAIDPPVSLTAIKGEPSLAQIMLVRQGRLSVMPLEKAEFDTILALSQKS